jgi:hypothetical protein
MPAPTNIDHHSDTRATFHRPPWMTSDAEWRRVVAVMVDHWTDVLEDSARSLAAERRASGDR